MKNCFNQNCTVQRLSLNDNNIFLSLGGSALEISKSTSFFLMKLYDFFYIIYKVLLIIFCLDIKKLII